MQMEMKIKKKNYIYDSETQEVFLDGELAPDQEKLLKVIYHFIGSIRERGYHSNLNYDEMDSLVKVLEPFEKEELFHQIYETYIYIGEFLAEDDDISQAEFSKTLSRLKRYEVYLYKLSNS